MFPSAGIDTAKFRTAAPPATWIDWLKPALLALPIWKKDSAGNRAVTARASSSNTWAPDRWIGVDHFAGPLKDWIDPYSATLFQLEAALLKAHAEAIKTLGILSPTSRPKRSSSR
jgi:hypothetical protein